MKCVLHSIIVLIPIITIGIFYFCDLGGFSGKPQKEIFECRKQVLSCTKTANQIIKELQVEQISDTETFENMRDKYSQDGTVTSNIECQDDLSFCKTKTIETTADALQVKFSFNCTSNLQREGKGGHHCDKWDYFDIYIHCDAKGNEHLLSLEHMWEEDTCNLEKDKNGQCDKICIWMHEVTRSSRIVKRQAILADSPTAPPPPTTTPTTTPSTIPSTTETFTFPPTVSMASISRPPTITVAVQTTIPSTAEVTTAAVTTPTMASNTAIPTIPATGSTAKPKRRIPAHCLRKPVGPPPGPITTASTPLTGPGTGSTTNPSTMSGTGSTITTPSTVTGTGSTTTPSTMSGTGSTTTPSTMTGTGSTTTPSTMSGTGSTTAPSTMSGNGSTTTPSTMSGNGSTTTTPSTMSGTGSTTTPSTMTGTGSTKPPSTITTTTAKELSPTTTTLRTTKAPSPPPPPPPRPPPPPPCIDRCQGPGFHLACNDQCFWCWSSLDQFQGTSRCPTLLKPIWKSKA